MWTNGWWNCGWGWWWALFGLLMEMRRKKNSNEISEREIKCVIVDVIFKNETDDNVDDDRDRIGEDFCYEWWKTEMKEKNQWWKSITIQVCLFVCFFCTLFHQSINNIINRESQKTGKKITDENSATCVCSDN